MLEERRDQPREDLASRLGSVELEHDARVFNFGFAALDFTASAQNRYAYKLEGFDADWIDLGSQRFVTFTNLDAGAYNLRVRARTSDGAEGGTEYSLPVVIAAAPWATPGAYAGYMLLASLLAILQERLPQFAQWRALGLRQGEQLLLVATPLLIFCAIAWLLSIPLGALLSWVLIYKLNIISFGWSMPLMWEFMPALRLAGVVIVICGLTLLLVSFQWRRKMPQALAQLGETV